MGGLKTCVLQINLIGESEKKKKKEWNRKYQSLEFITYNLSIFFMKYLL